MIRFSLYDDIPAMTALWQEAFGDDESFINAFFKSFYTPQMCRYSLSTAR